MEREVNKLEKVLMERDGMTLKEARDLIREAKDDIDNFDDPDEFMAEWFGLEPDYLIDVICAK